MRNLVRRLLSGLNKNTLNNPDNRFLQALQAQEYDRLKKEMAQRTPASPALKGYKVYSQHDEDGIIAGIFKDIPGSRTFIEIGLQDGKECNTLNLLLNNWKGVWIEGDPEMVNLMSASLGGVTFPGKLKILGNFIDKDNITSIYKTCTEFLGVDNVSFFSLDIDGNDVYVLESMLANDLRPDVFCVEYNGKFPAGMDITIRYNPSHMWDKTDYQGGSLSAFANVFRKYGYTLVCCNIIGINAFFVKDEHMKSFKSYSEEELYQPCRYYLSPMVQGHPASLRFLKDRLTQ